MEQLVFIIYLEEDGATSIYYLSRGGWCNFYLLVYLEDGATIIYYLSRGGWRNYYLLIYLEEDGATIIYDPLAHNKQDRMNIEMVRS